MTDDDDERTPAGWRADLLDQIESKWDLQIGPADIVPRQKTTREDLDELSDLVGRVVDLRDREIPLDNLSTRCPAGVATEDNIDDVHLSGVNITRREAIELGIDPDSPPDGVQIHDTEEDR